MDALMRGSNERCSGLEAAFFSRRARFLCCRSCSFSFPFFCFLLLRRSSGAGASPDASGLGADFCRRRARLVDSRDLGTVPPPGTKPFAARTRPAAVSSPADARTITTLR